jgi:sugar phosphate isomerase/epimerase
MIKLGINSVLFKTLPFREAAKLIKQCGYDGVEISAIKGMCEHLDLENLAGCKDEIKSAVEEYQLPILSTEVASTDKDRLKLAFIAAKELQIPVVNIGPGGVAGDEESLKQSISTIKELVKMAEEYGIILCVKAHVGCAVYSTPTTLRIMDEISSPAFGIDMDPSHIYRAGEKPEQALPAVISKVKHIHIRDCKGEGPSPGTSDLQACGKGDIDLYGYFDAMVKNKYNGPVCLEVIGPDLDAVSASIIAAESYGYMNACLKKLGGR